MLRASSLGLRLPPIAIPALQKCLRLPGAIVGHRSLTLMRRYLATHFSARLYQGRPGDRQDTESFRPGGVGRPVIFFSSLTESQPRSALRIDDVSAQEELEDSDPVLETDAEASTINISMLAQDQLGLDIVETTETGEGSDQIPPLESFEQEGHTASGHPTRRSVKPLWFKNQAAIPLQEDGVNGAESTIIQDMLWVLATTCSAKDGWEAFEILSRLQREYDTADGNRGAVQIITFAHLHRLARVIAQRTPRTRTQFLNLLTVLTTIQNYGGQIQLHEWNALIDYAGKGSRKTRSEDFNNALSIYHDMIYNRQPGSRFSEVGFDELFLPDSENNTLGHTPFTPAVQPDIYTYTTLIDIAARTMQPSIIQRAAQLLKQAGLPPNRITHLCLLKYFTMNEQISGVRETIARMQEQNLEIGIDGINACMWAYGHFRRVDTVMMIYRVLRHNMVPEEPDDHDDITSVQEQLRVEEGIDVAPELRPNEITFTLMIQVMSYHGNLLATLNVFLDMLSTPNPLAANNGDLLPAPYCPTIHVFRAIFLGFSRHGVKSNTHLRRSTFTYPDLDNPEWNLANLQAFFEQFLDLPGETKITESTIFWILNSFSKTSGHDVPLLRTAWVRMETRFGRFRGGRNHRLTRWRLKLFPNGEEIG